MATVEWAHGKLRFIDQTRLPFEEVYVETEDYRRIGEAIMQLQIRGAPAIGVAAAYGAFLSIATTKYPSTTALKSDLFAAIDFLSRTRPTAVNLFTGLRRVRHTAEKSQQSSVDGLREELFSEARAFHKEDIEACRRIGEFGAALIHSGSILLTHCNAGALATSGSGTALAVITTAARQHKVVKVFADETRPLFQGARLTAWELIREGIPVVLITDSSAGFVLAREKVDAVIVGADRIAANGDVANKIGTYPLAVLARRHGVPFYVAAPTSTVDWTTAQGDLIPIEERDAREVTHVRGMRIAAEGVAVFAPAFDVTPNEFVTAIVTEKGVLLPPFGETIAGLFREPIP